MAKITCGQCGGTVFSQGLYYRVWYTETYDTATETADRKEVDSEMEDVYEEWACVNGCYEESSELTDEQVDALWEGHDKAMRGKA